MRIAVISSMSRSFAKLPPLAIKAGTLFFMVSLAFGFAATSHAKHLSKKSYEEKTLQIWDQDIQYQYLVKKNPNVDFDGEASVDIVNGQKVYKIAINPVFFEREAKDLFRKFLKEKTASSPNGFIASNKELLHLEKELLEMSRADSTLTNLPPETKTELKKVQQELEKLAWQDLFEDCRKNSDSLKEAEKNFVRKFTEDRILAIEHHEAAHVLDLKTAEGKTDHEDFAKFTELNAFYTELAFGSNPLDVMSQAISGLIEETDKGKEVDFSVEKVAKVISFLKKCPRFASRFSGKKMPKCCLEIMADLTHQEFRFAAKELYHNNYRVFKPLLASLR